MLLGQHNSIAWQQKHHWSPCNVLHKCMLSHWQCSTVGPGMTTKNTLAACIDDQEGNALQHGTTLPLRKALHCSMGPLCHKAGATTDWHCKMLVQQKALPGTWHTSNNQVVWLLLMWLSPKRLISIKAARPVAMQMNWGDKIASLKAGKHCWQWCQACHTANSCSVKPKTHSRCLKEICSHPQAGRPVSSCERLLERLDSTALLGKHSSNHCDLHVEAAFDANTWRTNAAIWAISSTLTLRCQRPKVHEDWSLFDVQLRTFQELNDMHAGIILFWFFQALWMKRVWKLR